jgi:hypothetical protein
MVSASLIHWNDSDPGLVEVADARKRLGKTEGSIRSLQIVSDSPI